MAKKNIDTQIAVMSNDISYIKERVQRIDHKLDADYVTKTEFEPVKRIVYGIVALIGAGVLGALLKLVFIP